MTALTTIPSPWLFGAAGAIAISTFLCCRRWYGKRIGELQVRLRKRHQAYSGLLEQQAGLRSQVDSLRSEVRAQRALAASLHAKVSAQDEAAERRIQANAMNGSFIVLPRSPAAVEDFEDTHIM